MIGDAVQDAFQEVKNDIKLNCPEHPLLETTEMTVTTVGLPEYSQPTKANVVKSVVLYDGPDTLRGTITTSSTSGGVIVGIGLATALASTITSDDVVGKKVFLLTNTGSLQHSNITAWGVYTSSSVSISPSMSTTPTNGVTTYLVGDHREELYDNSRQILNYQRSGWSSKGRPTGGSLEGETLYLNIPADKIYPLIWTYYIDIDQMDEDSTSFLKILREWRNVFVEGVTAKSMVLYDDNRQYEHIRIYEHMIDRLRSETISFTQTVPYDPTYC